MTSPLDPHRAAIAALCRAYRVQRLDLFGSAARDDFDPAISDFDFVIEFEDDPSINTFNAYFDFKDALGGLLGRPVDLVMLGAVRNPIIRSAIDRDREPVFAA